jgi:hypothetical protein
LGKWMASERVLAIVMVLPSRGCPCIQQYWIEPDMPTKSHDDGLIDEFLHLAGVSTENSAARSWLESALAAARSIGDARSPQPPLGKYNVPLDKIARSSDRLIALLGQLRRYPHAHASFWSLAAFGPVCAGEFERPSVIGTLTDIRAAARKARVGRTGRPRKSRKQHIVDLALAFCARFSRRRPTADVNNFFPRFAERFFEVSTRLSAEQKSHGIDRQITVAVRRLPLEMQRAKLLNKTHLR